jgi:hypothetical protein
MGDSIFEVEHHPGEDLILHFKLPKLQLLPDPTREHLLAAQREILLALRATLDRAIERTEESEKKRKRTKIEVE